MSYLHLRRIEDLARIAGQFEDPDPVILPPTRWGPASWFRAALAVMAVLIALVWLFG